ncbi:hypothetical protein Hokovirus_3_25 [Hokovirus HKV1]|uniref:Proliferating cell nuclear antigen n=1 Tax=Hokovirus HKV1 TaxID=1977638 RepID=A0A1V0SGA7_9VIRU|nr:hypothetical protein Hokovirus_3_25 [Hokovirus HKV1]
MLVIYFENLSYLKSIFNSLSGVDTCSVECYKKDNEKYVIFHALNTLNTTYFNFKVTNLNISEPTHTKINLDLKKFNSCLQKVQGNKLMFVITPGYLDISGYINNLMFSIETEVFNPIFDTFEKNIIPDVQIKVNSDAWFTMSNAGSGNVKINVSDCLRIESQGSKCILNNESGMTIKTLNKIIKSDNVYDSTYFNILGNENKSLNLYFTNKNNLMILHHIIPNEARLCITFTCLSE